MYQLQLPEMAADLQPVAVGHNRLQPIHMGLARKVLRSPSPLSLYTTAVCCVVTIAAAAFAAAAFTAAVAAAAFAAVIVAPVVAVVVAVVAAVVTVVAAALSWCRGRHRRCCCRRRGWGPCIGGPALAGPWWMSVAPAAWGCVSVTTQPGRSGQWPLGVNANARVRPYRGLQRVLGYFDSVAEETSFPGAQEETRTTAGSKASSSGYRGDNTSGQGVQMETMRTNQKVPEQQGTGYKGSRATYLVHNELVSVSVHARRGEQVGKQRVKSLGQKWHEIVTVGEADRVMVVARRDAHRLQPDNGDNEAKTEARPNNNDHDHYDHDHDHHDGDGDDGDTSHTAHDATHDIRRNTRYTTQHTTHTTRRTTGGRGPDATITAASPGAPVETGQNRLQPTATGLGYDRLRGIEDSGATGKNRLASVAIAVAEFRPEDQPVKVRLLPNLEKNRTQPDFQTLNRKSIIRHQKGYESIVKTRGHGEGIETGNH
ncbi:hypothetical protein EDB84DRAFT_1446265 [Lactarius hengduanensis]|nr:hypothetical protein EDB84DRAFT_1446265 [Lactarius hengduanensis]